jgi:hypothetical protein
VNVSSGGEADLSEWATLVEEEFTADQARRFHEAEAKKYERVRDRARAQLSEKMGDAAIGVINGKPVLKRTTSKQFAHARFRERYPDLYSDYLVPKLEYVLDMDKLRTELPRLVEEFSSVRWTNTSEVLEP